MRFIDADMLDVIGVTKPTECDLDSFMAGMEAVTEIIDNLPTVDAIPVEWIKETKSLARTVGVWQYELFLETILKDWEEENASRKTYDKK